MGFAKYGVFPCVCALYLRVCFAVMCSLFTVVCVAERHDDLLQKLGKLEEAAVRGWKGRGELYLEYVRILRDCKAAVQAPRMVCRLVCHFEYFRYRAVM